MQALAGASEVRDDAFLYVLTEEILPEQEGSAEGAARLCPRQAKP